METITRAEAKLMAPAELRDTANSLARLLMAGGEVDAHVISWARAVYRNTLKTPATPRDAFDWVAKAVGPTDTIEGLRFVYATGAKILATNGHRIHAAQSGMQPGYYCPVTRYRLSDPEDLCGRFPVDSAERLLDTSQYEPAKPTGAPRTAAAKTALVEFMTDSGRRACIQMSYAKEAGYGQATSITATRTAGSVCIQSPHGQAVIAEFKL